MHCDLRKAPLQARQAALFRHQVLFNVSEVVLNQQGIEQHHTSSKSSSCTLSTDWFHRQENLYQLFLRSLDTLGKEFKSGENSEPFVKTLLEAAVCPSSNGLSSIRTIALVRVVFARLSSAAFTQPQASTQPSATALETTGSSNSCLLDERFHHLHSVSVTGSAKLTSLERAVTVICEELNLDLEAQLVLELALCKPNHLLPFGTQINLPSIDRFQRRVRFIEDKFSSQVLTCALSTSDSHLYSAEDKPDRSLWSVLPVDLVEIVFHCLQDNDLRSRICRGAWKNLIVGRDCKVLVSSLQAFQSVNKSSSQLDCAPVLVEADKPADLNRFLDKVLLIANRSSDGAVMEQTTVEKLICELGLTLTAAPERCEAALRELSRTLGLTGAPLIARLVSAMCKSHLPVSNEDPVWMAPCNVLSGGWSGGGGAKESSQQQQSEALDWNVDVLLRGIAAVEPSLDWKEVIRNFDRPGVLVRDRAGLRFLWQLITKAYDSVLHRIPMDLIYGKWKNFESQFLLLKQLVLWPDIVRLNECQPCTRLEPATFDSPAIGGGNKGCSLVGPSGPGSASNTSVDDDSSNSLAANWKVMEVHESLMSLAAERPELAAAVADLYKLGREAGCHDALTLALLQLNAPVTALRRLLLLQFIPFYLGVSAHNAQAVLHVAWSGCPHHLQQDMHVIVKDAMVEYYSSGDGESSRLTRILELAQEIKCLQSLLATTRVSTDSGSGSTLVSHQGSTNQSSFLTFVIDLACLASRREYLKLDKWMIDNLNSHPETFMPACTQFLMRKVPYLSNPMVDATTHLITQDCVHTMLVTMLAQIPILKDEKMKLRMSDLLDTIGRMMENFQLYVKRRQQQQNLAGAGPPQVQTQVLPPPQSNTVGVFGTPLATMGPNHLNSPHQAPHQGSHHPSVHHHQMASHQVSGHPVGPPTVPPPGPATHLGPPPANQQQTPAELMVAAAAAGFRSATALQQLGYTQAAGPKVPPSAQPPQQVFGPPPHGAPPIGLMAGPIGPHGGMPAIPPLAPPLPVTTDEFLQCTDFSKVHISKEIEDEANSYFQTIYNQPQIKPETIKTFLEMLRRFSNSVKVNEREVFQCMIKNLFEEYRFFPSYPDKELTITAQLFGGIIDYELVRYQTLTMAHKYVMDAIKKPQNVKMFYFGIVALDCFKSKLKQYPIFCQHLQGGPTYGMVPEYLQQWVEYGAKAAEPPNRPKGCIPLLNNGKLSAMAPPNSSVSTHLATVSQTGLASHKKVSSGPPITTSIAAATNIDTLLGASAKIELKQIAPNEATQDKIGFIINNLSQANVQQKSEEFRDLVGEDLYPWFAHYMVVKRASIESNFHSLYVNFLDTINSQTLASFTLAETYRNIRVLLQSNKDVSDFTDRSLLKSLGHWLGLLTIARNRPILALDIDLKALLVEAYHKGLQDLLYVVPFIAKILESAVKSRIFRPPNPFTMGVLFGLVELHSEQGLKLNLKFEVEVLCKILCVDIQQVKADAISRGCFSLLKDASRLALIDVPLLGPPVSQQQHTQQQQSQQGTQDVQASAAVVQAAPSAGLSQQQQASTSSLNSLAAVHMAAATGGPTKVSDIIPMMQQFGMSSQNAVGGLQHQSGAGQADEFLQQQQQQQQQQLAIVPHVGAPQVAAMAASMMSGQPSHPTEGLSPAHIMQQQQQQAPAPPQYYLREFNSVTFAMLPSLVSIPHNIALFQAHPNLKLAIRAAVERGIQEWSQPVIERCLKIALVTCENIIKKDFVLEPDESKMRVSLHNMVRSVTAGMVMITCKEPLFITISSHAKSLLRNALGQFIASQQNALSAAGFPSKEHLDAAAVAVASENVELATCFIQKVAIQRAISEIDKKFAREYELRKAARKEGKVYCDPQALSYQERIPELLRLKLGGVTPAQMAVYEEFARNVPGFASASPPAALPFNDHSAHQQQQPQQQQQLPRAFSAGPPPHDSRSAAAAAEAYFGAASAAAAAAAAAGALVPYSPQQQQQQQPQQQPQQQAQSQQQQHQAQLPPPSSRPLANQQQQQQQLDESAVLAAAATGGSAQAVAGGLIDKMLLELEMLAGYISAHAVSSSLAAHAMPQASQLVMNVHVVQDALHVYRSTGGEPATAYVLVHKTVESLLDGMLLLSQPAMIAAITAATVEGGGHPAATDWSAKYRDTHLLVLKALADRSLLGLNMKIANIVTKIFLEHPNDEARFNLPAFDALLRSNLINIPLLDMQMAKMLEHSVSFPALGFAKDLVRVVASYRESGVMPDISDMPHTFEAIYHHRRLPPPPPPNPAQTASSGQQGVASTQQSQLQHNSLNSNVVGDEFVSGGTGPNELLLNAPQRSQGPAGGQQTIDYNSPPMALMHSGMSEARNAEPDPPGLQEKTEYLLREWVQMFSSQGLNGLNSASNKDSTKAFQMFVQQMNMHGILKTDDLITKFFRLATEMCVENTYRTTAMASQQVQQAALATQSQAAALVSAASGLGGDGNTSVMAAAAAATHNASALAAHQTVNLARNKCFVTLDAYVRLIALLVKLSGDQTNPTTKVNLLNKVLGIIAGVLVHDHESRGGDFRQLAYHRMFLMLFLELTAPEPILEVFSFQTLMAFCNTLHALHPFKVPGFSFAWLELISHRMFLARMLAITPQQKAWGMFAQLLQDLFKFLSPFLRNMELSSPVQLLYKGTIRLLLVLLHDFPEFLVDYHYGLCDLIPANCVQMRNLILSAFPRHMRLPDPFTPHLRVDTLPECAIAPRVLPNFVAIVSAIPSLRKDIDTYLKSRQPSLTALVADLIDHLFLPSMHSGSATNNAFSGNSNNGESVVVTATNNNNNSSSANNNCTSLSQNQPNSHSSTSNANSTSSNTSNNNNNVTAGAPANSGGASQHSQQSANVARNALTSSTSDSSGPRYNIPLINAVVLYIGTQAINGIQHPFQFGDSVVSCATPQSAAGGSTNSASSQSSGTHIVGGINAPMTWQGVSRSAHADLFELLMARLDNEGRYLVLNAIANQLRFPNSHTAYFSALMLSLFACCNSSSRQQTSSANSSVVNEDLYANDATRSGGISLSTANIIRELITRVLLERLIVNRPHPWGLLVTFVELLKNQQLKFWQYEFIRCAPEIEKLFESVARSCVGQVKSVSTD